MEEQIKTTPHYIQRLNSIIQSGECVLFLGAGISIDSGAPAGSELANRIAKHFFGFEDNSYSLDMICQLVDANESRKALNEFIIQELEKLTPGEAISYIPHFRWKSIYTVNFDTLLEQVYRNAFDRLQNLRVFYTNKDRLSKVEPNEVPLYKIHGCIDRANHDDGRLILTQDDFTWVEENRNRFFSRLTEDVNDYTILYVGFRRQDPDFMRSIRAIEKTSQLLGGLRRCYALQPHFIEPEERLAEQNKVTLIKQTASEFFTVLKSAEPPSTSDHDSEASRNENSFLSIHPKVSNETLAHVEQNFEVIDARIIRQEPNSQDFYAGAQPNWGLVASKFDATRDICDTILTDVIQEPLLDKGNIQFCLIHAEAGTGKSTLLKRIGVELALTWNYIVLSLKPFGELDFFDIERLSTTAEERVYVLIDDASNIARELSSFFRTAKRAKTRLTVIATTRTNEWREAQEDLFFPQTSEYELGRLSSREIESLIDVLTQNNALGLLSGTSYETKVAAFETRADKQLLVALKEATEGKSFDEIIVDEYDRIPSPEGKDAYLIVASLHKLGLYTRVGLLHRVMNIPFEEFRRKIFDPTMKVIVPREVLGEKEQYYSTRHQLIAEIVFDRILISDRRRADFYLDIISNLDIGYSSDEDIYRKLTRGANKKLLADINDQEYKREIMQRLMNIDQSDAYALQHAAMMEMEHGNLYEASYYINKAIAKKPSDPAIRDTEGKLALEIAITTNDPHLADTKFAIAEQLFSRNIQRRFDEPFGYRHLAETYASWSKIQTDKRKKLMYISLAYEWLLKGLNSCSSISMLLQYQGVLEENLGNLEEALAAFNRALQEKPNQIATRFMAARLEERLGRPEKALQILSAGLNSSPYDAELHFRIATLMTKIRYEDNAEICKHFEASLLGSLRNYQARLAYGAYLFSKDEYEKSKEQFSRLDDLIVSTEERFEVHKFDFISTSRYRGTIRSVSYTYGFVEYSHGTTSIFFSPRELAKSRNTYLSLTFGKAISYQIGFNFKGAIAFNVEIDD